MSDFMWCDIFNYEYLQGGTIRKYTVQEYFYKTRNKSHPSSTCFICMNTSTLSIHYEICSYHLLVAISETTKLFLPRGVPAIEADFATVGAKIQRVNFNTNGGCNGRIKLL